jgi:hypothetical protein
MKRRTWSGVATLLVCVGGGCTEDEVKKDATATRDAPASSDDAAESSHGAATAGAAAPKSKSKVAEIPQDMRPERILPNLEQHLLAPNLDNGGKALFTDIVKVPAGSDMMFCTYVGEPAKEKYYLHDTKAVQSKYGHHAILQYSLNPQPPGTTHECPAGGLEQQQQQIIGGMGEGANIQYPDNVVSEIPAGAQLMINHHWVNVSESEAEAQAEIVTVPPDPNMKDLVVARTLVVQSTKFSVAPKESGSTSVECKLDHDVQLISSLGHMHEWGTHVKAERGGTEPDVLFDYAYSPLEAIHPKVNYYELDDPYRIKAGDSLKITCQWDNTTAQPLTFPGEMCAIATWQVGATSDALCFDGVWQTGAVATGF